MDDRTLQEIEDRTYQEIEELTVLRDKLIDECYQLRSRERDARSSNPLGPGEFLTLSAWARLVGISPRTANELRARWTGRGFPAPSLTRRGVAYYDRAQLGMWYDEHRRV